jgi:hypothetical protein
MGVQQQYACCSKKAQALEHEIRAEELRWIGGYYKAKQK